MTAAIPIGRLEPGTDAWLDARRRRIGGSEIAAVMGISPFDSPFSLWHRKRGMIGPVEQTPEMLWGQLLEPVVAEHFATEHPDVSVRVAPSFVHGARDYQTAAPDRLVFASRGARRPIRIYEGKTARIGDDWGEPGTDEIPVYYRAQVLWYLDCLALPEADVAVLIGGSDYREYLVRAAPDEADVMRGAAAAFIASLDDGVSRPPIDDHHATYQAVKELHPEIDGSMVEVPEAVADAYVAACDEERAAKNAKRQAAAVLADAMGTAREAWSGGVKIAIRVPGVDGAPPHLRPAARKAAA